MAKITQQAQRAIDKMKAAGWKRSEFRVRTESKYVGIYNGTRCYEYGNASIICWASAEKQEEKAEAMLDAGLDLTYLTPTSKYPMIREAKGEIGRRIGR